MMIKKRKHKRTSRILITFETWEPQDSDDGTNLQATADSPNISLP